MPNKVTSITLTATIPTAEYANLQPSITVEVDGDAEGAKKTALEHIVSISQEYAMKGKSLESQVTYPVDLEKVESPMTGGVAYKDQWHHFWTADGRRYLSASRFASKFVEPFPAQFILPKMAKAYGGTEELHQAIWSLKGDVSTLFGKAVHAGIELYGRHHEMGAKTGAKEGINKALTDQPHIKKIVEDFFNGDDVHKPGFDSRRINEDAEYEVQIIDEKNARIAEVDRVKFVNREKKIIRIQDYKTNFDVLAKEKMLAPFESMPANQLSKYWLQLSFEAEIAKEAGYIVEGLDIFHLTADGWVTYSSEVIDIKEAL